MDLARATVKLFSARVGTAVLGLVGNAYFAWELGAGPLGVFFLYLALLSLLGIPADFGLAGALEKRISEGERRGAYLTSGVALKLVPIAVVLGVIWASAPTIDGYVGAEVALLLGLGIVLQEAMRLTMAVLKGELRVGETGSIELARSLFWILAAIVFVERGHGAVGLVYGHLVGVAVATSLAWYRCSVTPAWPAVVEARSLLDYGKFNVLSSMGTFVFNWMDVLVLGYFLTEAHVGAYEIAWRVAAAVFLLSQSIATVLFPQISSWTASDAEQQIPSAIRRSMTPSMALAIPALFGAALLAPELLGIAFGPEFVMAWIVLVVLMADKVIGSVNILFNNALRGIDRPDLVAYAKTAAIVTNLVCNVVLVQAIGIEGAAVATGLSGLVATVVNGYSLSRFVALDVPVAEIGWCVASAVLMSAVVLGVQVVVPVRDLPTLVLVVALGVAVYGLSLLAYAPLRSRVRVQVRSLLPEDAGLQ